ncbi:hypothetical protein LEP1GSC185_2363 [Leptospira licerasiae serovar Varillal str. VAR 010]|uniref:Uncharacterized protein n=1 Tax=Leptospira licerasiae str. MMD4847 TaxID=1049971 RepID=A0ABN0H9C9_9LEPT|nr:hypothetical protein LEP1GSC185_2363 [Leptospira licerasiae serovar Varillal str. VAR 010]EJZ42190.1 hypothetical protein LEP1GSC178_0003 [Leptospira licerasiae str. MMD4847]
MENRSLPSGAGAEPGDKKEVPDGSIPAALNSLSKGLPPFPQEVKKNEKAADKIQNLKEACALINDTSFFF